MHRALFNPKRASFDGILWHPITADCGTLRPRARMGAREGAKRHVEAQELLRGSSHSAGRSAASTPWSSRIRPHPTFGPRPPLVTSTSTASRRRRCFPAPARVACRGRRQIWRGLIRRLTITTHQATARWRRRETRIRRPPPPLPPAATASSRQRRRHTPRGTTPTSRATARSRASTTACAARRPSRRARSGSRRCSRAARDRALTT